MALHNSSCGRCKAQSSQNSQLNFKLELEQLSSSQFIFPSNQSRAQRGQLVPLVQQSFSVQPQHPSVQQSPRCEFPQVPHNCYHSHTCQAFQTKALLARDSSIMKSMHYAFVNWLTVLVAENFVFEFRFWIALEMSSVITIPKKQLVGFTMWLPTVAMPSNWQQSSASRSSSSARVSSHHRRKWSHLPRHNHRPQIV